MFTVTAVAKGERVYLSSSTDLKWRTMLVLSFDEVALSAKAAIRIYKLAQQDETLFDVRLDSLA